MSKSHGISLLVIFFLSAFLHFVAIDYPQEAVFDEVHFGKFVSGYLTGEYFFDIHPPMGKLAIAGIAKVGGFTPGFDFLKIGEQYPDSQYIWLRFLPALFGSLLAPLIYLLTLRLSRSIRAAQLAGLFIVFENALLVQSKFILIDSFLLFFGFAALYLFLESKIFFSEGKWGLWSCIVAAFFAGLAVSVKWTAAPFLGLILLFGCAAMIKKIVAVWKSKGIMRFTAKKEMMRALAGYIIFLIIPPVVYISLFAVHFNLLPYKGSGNAYMDARFQQSQLDGFPMRDFSKNFYELNVEMFRANQRITATHSYSSQWYTWPFMLRSVYYWNKDMTFGDITLYERIYLLGNPFIWWSSTVTLIYFFMNGFWRSMVSLFFFLRRKQHNRSPTQKQTHITVSMSLLLAGAYLMNFLPFMFIGRVMFLYHYLTALIWAIMITAVLVTSDSKPRTFFTILFVGGALAGFFIIFPVTYGTVLNAPWPTYIFWLKSWI
ncbi:MAG: phospholipid carrier-dependent glycosyltransferase [bacterium]|nr:phospholipid carrier-dependent glycosyltransferase [bacterium]